MRRTFQVEIWMGSKLRPWVRMNKGVLIELCFRFWHPKIFAEWMLFLSAVIFSGQDSERWHVNKSNSSSSAVSMAAEEMASISIN